MATASNGFLRWLGVSLFASTLLIAIGAEMRPGEPEEGVSLVLSQPSVDRPPLNLGDGAVIDRLRRDGRLVVLTRNAPTTYYLEREETVGFEYDLARAFAAHLGVEAEFVVYENVPALTDALKAGKGHIAAAGLARHETNGDTLTFGPGYSQVRQQLVCHREARLPSSPERLKDASIMVVANSSYDTRLKDLRQEQPALSWSAVYGFSVEDLMERVADGTVACTAGDSRQVSITRRYHPELVVPFDLTGPEPVAWALIDGAPGLEAAARDWFALEETQTLLRGLEERYYGHVPAYDYVDIARYQRRIEERLPDYRETFETAARETGLSWTLLAAIAYQESHWVPDATSPTGVRGMMMLTRATASDMGVSNRLDAEQSIDGGARYLASIKRRLPASITGEDRLWFALAAYNVGLGHLYDARSLARREGRNPDKWTDVKAMLPLLSQPAYYNTVTYGYARGHEPVRYVQRVRHYHDILDRVFPQGGV